MIILRLLWLLISWLAVELLLFLPLYLVGVLTFPIFYHYAPMKFAESRINRGEYIIAFKWGWLNEWLGNHEDGLLPNWWLKERDGSAYGWFLRNPICNIRFWPFVSTIPSHKTQHVGSLFYKPDAHVPGWFLAWHGAYHGFFFQTKGWGIWIGWKINPRDGWFINSSDYRCKGLGPVCQFWRS